MIDWYVILAPLLILPIVALLRFIGCYNPVFIFGGPRFDSTSVNCGGPHDFDEGVTYLEDNGGPADTDITEFESTGGVPQKLSGTMPVTSPDGSAAATVYGTCRTDGPDIKYQFSPVAGTYQLTLRFAEIREAQVSGDRVFSFLIDNGTGAFFNLPDGSNAAYDIIKKAGGRAITHDEQFIVPVVPPNLITVHFQAVSGASPGPPYPNPLINAIECLPIQIVTVTPGVVPVIEGQTQTFNAVASWDAAAPITWTVAGPGQIDASGVFTAPGGITVKTPTEVVATASFNGQPVTGVATVSIYPHLDTLVRGDAWLGNYGLDGYVLANSPEAAPYFNPPDYAKQFAATRLDNSVVDVYPFPGTAGAISSLVDTNGQPRASTVWDDPPASPPVPLPYGFILSFNLDSTPRLVGVYCVDSSAAIPARDQTITVLDTDTQAMLAQDHLQNFVGGVFVLYVLTGRIQIKITPNVDNAVASAVFFG